VVVRQIGSTSGGVIRRQRLGPVVPLFIARWVFLDAAPQAGPESAQRALQVRELLVVRIGVWLVAQAATVDRDLTLPRSKRGTPGSGEFGHHRPPITMGGVNSCRLAWVPRSRLRRRTPA
jgi:hypothetical protein